MKREFWYNVALLATISLFCRSSFGQERNFIQPCDDAGGYYSWLGGPNKNHLAHDYNAPEGTKVKAISDGIVWEKYTDISGFGSEGKQGPAIWIKHRLDNGKYFYALYGHVESTSDVRKGIKVKDGQIIGTIIRYLDKETKTDISHLHFGIWNSASDPPRDKLGYGPIRYFTDPIRFLEENNPYIQQKPELSLEEVTPVLKWTHEEIGKPGFISRPSKEGVLYLDVAGPDGPKLYAIDMKSGQILKTQEIKPGYHLLGISQNTLYLTPKVSTNLDNPKSFRFVIGGSLLALDRINWTQLWEKDFDDLNTSSSQRENELWVTEKGILYSRMSEIGSRTNKGRGRFELVRPGKIYKTEVCLLNEITGQAQILCKIENEKDIFVRSLSISYSNFKGLSTGFGLEDLGSVSANRAMENRRRKYTVSMLDLITGHVLWAKEWLLHEGGRSPLGIWGQWEANGKCFVIVPVDVTVGEIPEYLRIVSIDTNSGLIMWETEEFFDINYSRFVGATNNVMVIYCRISHGNVDYTLWYGIDVVDGKFLWKKWAMDGVDSLCMSKRTSYVWTETMGEIILIGESGRLILLNALTGDVIGQQEKFPTVRARNDHTVYKDILVIKTSKGIRAYQIGIPGTPYNGTKLREFWLKEHFVCHRN